VDRIAAIAKLAGAAVDETYAGAVEVDALQTAMDFDVVRHSANSVAVDSFAKLIARNDPIARPASIERSQKGSYGNAARNPCGFFETATDTM
jgi:hypothetical protein